MLSQSYQKLGIHSTRRYLQYFQLIPVKSSLHSRMRRRFQRCLLHAFDEMPGSESSFPEFRNIVIYISNQYANISLLAILRCYCPVVLDSYSSGCVLAYNQSCLCKLTVCSWWSSQHHIVLKLRVRRLRTLSFNTFSPSSN